MSKQCIPSNLKKIFYILCFDYKNMKDVIGTSMIYMIKDKFLNRNELRVDTVDL